MAAPLSAQQQHDDLLDIDDVLGKRLISTRLHRNITDPGRERDRGPGNHEPLCR